jgi:Regulator of ribonuclease activity B
MIYPDDDNGDVLRRMESHGDDLTRPRDIDFTVVFPDENSAQIFSKRFERLGYKVSMKFAEIAKGLPWDVLVVKHMMPSHQGVGDFEGLLQREGEALGGRNDGLGCISYGPDSANKGE